MLLISNRAAQTTPIAIPATATQIPFDTTVLVTNGNLALDSNNVNAVTAGIYDSVCQINVTNTSSSAAVTVTLQAYADGKAVSDATVTKTIAESAQDTLILPWVTNVITAPSGVAKLAWYLSGGAVNLTNAKARITRIV